MKNRFIILLLSFSILCISVFALPLSIVYATDSYGYTYEEAVDIVNKHNIIYSNEGTPMFIYSSASQLWSAPRYFFTNTYTDKELVDILSSDNVIQYAVTKAKYESISSQLCKALGYATKGASTLVTDMVAKDNRQFAKGTYSDDDGYSLVADSVDKLREQLKNQYYDSIGIVHLNINNERMNFSSTWFEEQDDYTSAFNLINSYDYQFMLDASFYGYDGREIGLYGFNRSAFNYCYLDGSKMCFVDTSLNNIPQADVFNYIPTIYQFDEDVHNSLVFASMYTKNSSYYSRYWDIEYSYKAISRGSWCSIVYSTKYNDFLFFKSYEALYNYLYGDQNAYLSSKIEETGEDIKISIDDMNTNISDKMDELIGSINSKKDGMSADELQNAIDKGLESISGKMDDIKDNTDETNAKLDTLLSAMQSQNEILMNILGVTTNIYNVVSSKDKEDDTNYTIADLQPHFNKCFTAVKNMVLYGESSFEDVGTQSVMNVDNDVGIAVYADDPENHVKDYHNGLLGKFPFCVPYQLYEWLQVLQADPETPEFTYDYGYMLKYFGVSSDTDTVIKFDLSQYDDWAKNARSFLKLSFTLAVAVGTYRKFKGEI